jgi:hypothetical protein
MLFRDLVPQKCLNLPEPVAFVIVTILLEYCVYKRDPLTTTVKRLHTNTSGIISRKKTLLSTQKAIECSNLIDSELLEEELR